MVGMTFSHLAANPHHALSVPLLPPLPPHGTLEELSNNAVTDWWWLIGPCLTILGTLVGALVLRWILHRAVDRVVDRALTRAAAHESQTPRRASRVLSHATGLDEARKTQRAATMGAILKSTSTFVIFVMVLLTIMATLGLPLGPLLASAGVGGIALAFGAQSLVRDVLSGIFMIIEDQYGVGDVIDTGEAIGTSRTSRCASRDCGTAVESSGTSATAGSSGSATSPRDGRLRWWTSRSATARAWTSCCR